jgi:radical SAM family uncharacterized protein
LEAQLRAHGLPLYSLETFTPLLDFDVLAFSAAYELCYTNVLTMLDLAGLPLRAAERRDGDPLVILGGHAAFSPEPLADFVDAFCLGDGEELAGELSARLAALKPLALPREELLLRLARETPGVYVPRFYRHDFGPDGRLRALAPLRPNLPFPVARRVVSDLERAPFPTAPVVPYVEAVFERYVVELMRGCVNGCRFCQAGVATRPRRIRGPEVVLELARRGLAATGYDELGLLSLSAGDYPDLPALARRVNAEFAPRGVSLSLPSLRVDEVLSVLPAEMAGVRKGALTLAPEAGTERLRAVINKPIRDEHLLAGCRAAFQSGYSAVKLYFMLGLPGETDEDLRAIGALAGRIARLRREVCGKSPAQVTLSVSSFIPKPGTPFQWAAMPARAEWKRRQAVVRDSIRERSVKAKFHNVEQSFLEGLFARGDRRLGKVLEAAWRRGARFDGWEDQFRFEVWEAAFAECGLDAEREAGRERAWDEVLPWAAVSDTASTAWLKREWEKSLRGETTPPCAPAPGSDKEGPCSFCDACARSPFYELKLRMLAAPLSGRARDPRALERWRLPPEA